MADAPRRIIIDTDPGIDDALAILMAIASPEIRVEALTIAGGNCSVDKGVVNALSILELVGAEHIPVMCGLEVSSYSGSNVHGERGLGYAKLPVPSTLPSSQPAVDGLVECILKNPHEITIVAIAPLTNLASAIKQEPLITELVQEIVVMGGAFKTYGNNENRTAECNIYNNPYAAKVVFDSGMPITLVPLDVTRKAFLREDDVKNLRHIFSESPVVEFFNSATQSYFKFHSWYQEAKSCVLHDPLALSLVIQANLVQIERLVVDVELSDPLTLGRTIGDFSKMNGKTPNLNVALDVEAARFIDLFLERLTLIAANTEKRK
jgi:purine nucleosidase